MGKMPHRIAMLFAAGLIATAMMPAWSQAPAVAAGRYSVSETLVGKLLDDPAAAAVLKALIPGVYANPQFQQEGRALTLRDIQTYEPDALSDANLAKIQGELNKLPPKP